MDRYKRTNLLLSLAILLTLGIMVVQLASLPSLRAQVRAGLRAGLDEMAHEIATELAGNCESMVRKQIGTDVSQKNNPLSARSFLLRPDSAKQSWNIQLLPSSPFENQDVAVTLPGQFEQVYSHWRPEATTFWQNLTDSILVITGQENPFSPILLTAFYPIFSPDSQLSAFRCMQFERRRLATACFEPYFRSYFKQNRAARDDGIQPAYLNIRIRGQNIVYQSSRLASGRMESYLQLEAYSPYLVGMQLETGFLWKDSAAVAAHLFQRNLWSLVAVFVILLLLMLLVMRSNRKAHQLDALRQDFLANVSHELKSPLASIRLAQDTLRLGRTSNPAVALDMIKRESQRLENRISTLLDVARMDAGQHDIKLTLLPINAWMTDQETKWMALMQLQDRSLLWKHTATPGKVMADPAALAQLLDIWFDNALKYAPTTEKLILKSDMKDGCWALSLQDSGPGIPKSEQGRIFDKFVRLSGRDQHDVQGYGLGLAIAKEVAQVHGAEIGVRSLPGQGSTFYIFIPLYHA
ncbi:MAG: HAMP domain-containing sensor histidine kinase [Bacteroidota bacterium]